MKRFQIALAIVMWICMSLSLGAHGHAESPVPDADIDSLIKEDILLGVVGAYAVTNDPTGNAKDCYAIYELLGCEEDDFTLKIWINGYAAAFNGATNCVSEMGLPVFFEYEKKSDGSMRVVDIVYPTAGSYDETVDNVFGRFGNKSIDAAYPGTEAYQNAMHTLKSVAKEPPDSDVKTHGTLAHKPILTNVHAISRDFQNWPKWEGKWYRGNDEQQAWTATLVTSSQDDSSMLFEMSSFDETQKYQSLVSTSDGQTVYQEGKPFGK